MSLIFSKISYFRPNFDLFLTNFRPNFDLFSTNFRPFFDHYLHFDQIFFSTFFRPFLIFFSRSFPTFFSLFSIFFRLFIQPFFRFFSDLFSKILSRQCHIIWFTPMVRWELTSPVFTVQSLPPNCYVLRFFDKCVKKCD